MKRTTNIIVTFCCSKAVHVYSPSSHVLPRYPYKFHDTEDKAKDYLKLRGIKEPKVIIEN